MASLFGSSPEELRQQARTAFTNQRRQALASMPNMGGGGLAGRLAQLGQTAGMALGGMGQKPALDTKAIKIAENRQRLLGDIFSGDKTPTSTDMLKGMKTLMEAGDTEGGLGMFKLYAQMGALEATKAKAAKGTKPTYKTVDTPQGKQVIKIEEVNGETITTPVTEAVPAKGLKPESTVPSKGDLALSTTQMKQSLKGMDITDEYLQDPDKFEPIIQQVAGIAKTRMAEAGAGRTAKDYTAELKKVWKELVEKGGIKKDTTMGFVEPVFDQDKIDAILGETVSEEKPITADVFDDVKKKRLEELRAKQAGGTLGKK